MNILYQGEDGTFHSGHGERWQSEFGTFCLIKWIEET